MYNKIKIVVLAILVLLIVIVVFQNTEPVETKILFLKLTMPRAAMLFVTLVIGFALGVLTAGRLVGKLKQKQTEGE
jgi:uncharacterized integral membrane protein